MTVREIFTYLGLTPVDGVFLLLFIFSGFIQISKININPWTAVGNLIRNILLKDVNQSIQNMNNTQMKVQKDLVEHIAQSHRRVIIDFTTECMDGKTHTKEQFNFVFKTYRDYEKYIKDNNLTNDEVNESIAYIRRIYQNRLSEGHFEG